MKRLFMFLMGCFFLVNITGCAGTLFEISLTHARVYKANPDSLPQGDEAKEVSLQKVVDIDLAKVAEGIASLIETAFTAVFGLGDMLFKGITAALIVEGPPAPNTGTG